ncbi:unnamed protein product, partial [Allacma fusca]
MNLACQDSLKAIKTIGQVEFNCDDTESIDDEETTENDETSVNKKLSIYERLRRTMAKIRRS